ncbi:extracellular calcium-sensing receptor-like [Cheilinus undulatus]|uniref:extracellular calcium-sensing receptor-like n=1 Tax=Cheilinus undulatus TaxID=241271 RepID=UPI001BD6BB85|nr:extracellular calcium-sensing receptor-like [Cheilinus undulatus]
MDTRELRFARAMIFAIEEINNSSELLPGIKLGYQIHDSCGSVSVAAHVAFQLTNGLDPVFYTGEKCSQTGMVMGIVGASGSTPSISMSRVIGSYNIPQVSYFSTCACLSDKQQYPNFFRTIPSDQFQADALAKLVKHFGWTWIGAVRSDSDYGNNGMAAFLKAARKEGICVEYSESFYRSHPRSRIQRVAEVIRRSTAVVVVAFVASGDMTILLEELSLNPPPPRQWIGGESWVTAPEMLRFNFCIGTIGFGIQQSIIPGFRDFLLDLSPAEVAASPLLTEFWEDAFSCRLGKTPAEGESVCDGTEALHTLQSPYTDTSQLRVTNMVYKAVYAIAHAIHNTMCQSTNTSQCDTITRIETQQVLTQLKKVNFSRNGYQVSFDANGDPVAMYELVNWQRSASGGLEFVTVGHYDASLQVGEEFQINRDVTWMEGSTQVPVSMCTDSCPPGTRKVLQKGKPICCYDCIPCPDGEISNDTDSSDCFPCPMEFWPNTERDTCLPKPVEFLSFNEVLGIILAAFSVGGACLAIVTAAVFLRHRKTPIVSYFATCTCLTDKHMYPSFLRTVPNDLFQVRGLVQLVTFLGWFWVGTLGTTDDYSQYGIQAFSNQFKQQGGCLSFHLNIPKSPTVAEIHELADKLQSSTARVVVVFATEGQLVDLFLELAERNVTGLQWVASEAWVTATLLTSLRFHSVLEGTLGFSFPGVRIPGLEEFLLNVRPSSKPGMELINISWEELFDCTMGVRGDTSKDAATDANFVGQHNSRNISGSLVGEIVGNIRTFKESLDKTYNGVAERPVCNGSEGLRYTESSYTDVSQVRISYNVYKAVYAIAHALHTLLNCDSMDKNKGICEKHKFFTSKQLLHHLQTVNFTNQFGEKVHFDSSGEPVPLYDIINWQRDSTGEIRFVKVGSYDGSAPLRQQLQLVRSAIVWTKGQSQVPISQCSVPCSPGSRQARRPGEPHCCFDCLPCADGEFSNQTGSTECTKCPEYYWSDKDKVKCVAGVEEFLSFYDTMGITLVTLTLLGFVLTCVITTVFHRFRFTPIVKANNSEISFLLLLSLKLCFLCSLVFIGQPSVWTCRLRQAAFGISFVLCLSCLLVKTIVVLFAFWAKVPGSRALKLFGPSQQRTLILCTTIPQVCLCVGWLLCAPPFPFRNPTYQASTGKIVVECKEPWPPGFYLVLSYIGLLAFLCLLLAYLGRKLPDTFNEAKLITFSMLIFWAVWISFIPAYVSSPGKFTVAVEVFAILASSFGLLVCIFVPKCYIILLMPEKNTKRGLSGKYLR